MSFRNSPELKDESNNGKVKRYVHQPLTFDHYGIRCTVKENGHIVIASPGTPVKGSDEIEYDEVEIPASLVFKLVDSLNLTRTIKYVSMSEAKTLPAGEEI